MIFRLRLFSWRFTFTMAPVTRVTGVNSRLPDGRHVLMWDFDDTNLLKVAENLEIVQRTYKLPRIYILETKKDTNYIAYCLKSVPWRKAIEIIAYTKGVCYNFFKFGIYRGQFTLRVSAKAGRVHKLVMVLPSKRPETASVKDLKSWVNYETIAKPEFAVYSGIDIDKNGVEIKRPSTLKRP